MAERAPDPTSGPEPSRPPESEPVAVTRERVVRLAFGGDERRFEQFLDALREVTPPDACVILRGSAVTGRRWLDGQPFDADGPGTSDLDVTFIGGDMSRLWESFYIPGLHTVPLSDEHPDASPALTPLRRALCRLAGRPVNLQATTSLVQYVRDVVLDQPYVALVEESEGRFVPTSDASGAGGDSQRDGRGETRGDARI